jgi:hypothetical protein
MSGILVDTRTGPVTNQDGPGNQALRQGRTAALIVSAAHAKYYEAVSRGNVYFASIASGAPTAYVGAAGGTPLLAVHNPTGSNMALVVLAASGVIRVTAIGANTTGLNLWAGSSVTPTGTQTVPRNALTYAQGGIGLGFSNAALTGSTALNLALALNSYYWATAAGAFVGQGFVDIDGLIVLVPGMQVALGASTVPTSTTWDASLYWEQVPL